MDGTGRSTVRLVLLLGTALGFLLTCKIPQNPLRAGSSTSTAAQLDHPINFGGHKHADGYCNPIDNCSACHGSSLQGGSHGEPSCTSCHGTFWTDPKCGKFSQIHTINRNGVLHGANSCQPQGVCAPCHGGESSGRNQRRTGLHQVPWTRLDERRLRDEQPYGQLGRDLPQAELLPPVPELLRLPRRQPARRIQQRTVLL